MNVKRIVYILIGVMLVTFAIGFLSWKLPGNNLNLNPEKYDDFDEKTEENIDGIDEIYINTSFAKVNIISEDRKDISINYYGKLSPYYKTSLNTESTSSKLTIEATSKNKHTISLGPTTNLYLDIILPNSYTNNLNVKTDLGSINLKDLEFNDLQLHTSLGEITLENVSSMENRLFTELGEVKVKNIQGDLKAKTEMGSIELDYDKLDWDIDASSELGSIKIILPEDSNFTIDAETELGKIKSNFPFKTSEKSSDISDNTLKAMAGNGENIIFLSVELGSIKINSK